MTDWGILLILFSALWAAAVLACSAEEGGVTFWDFMVSNRTELHEIQGRLGGRYPWIGLTMRLRPLAIGTLILGVALYAIAY